MSGLLQRIIQTKTAELEELRRRRMPTRHSPRPVNLKRPALGALALIAEIKFRSPSAGELSKRLDVAGRAKAYAAAGASMISVLCDTPFFGGSYADLEIARDNCEVPLLCKEFIVDEIQLDAARAYGADWVLLIARCLSPERAHELLSAAHDRGLGVLFEVHVRDEPNAARELNADAIGVNARDLDTLQMDLPTAAAILESVSPCRTAIHLSGIKGPDDVRRLLPTRADAALIGEVLMRQDDPRAALETLVSAARAVSVPAGKLG